MTATGYERAKAEQLERQLREAGLPDEIVRQLAMERVESVNAFRLAGQDDAREWRAFKVSTEYARRYAPTVNTYSEVWLYVQGFAREGDESSGSRLLLVVRPEPPRPVWLYEEAGRFYDGDEGDMAALWHHVVGALGLYEHEAGCR